jgi:2-dehydro-3-deoxyphosphooctonate aldolase (KDO 8-P synthase)
MSKHIQVKGINIGNDLPFVFISGPCQIESRDHCMRTANSLQRISASLDVGLVFKSSYDKANRSSLGSQRGVGIQEGLRILEDVRNEIGCPVLTDVHSEADAVAAGQVVDVIQIPAFLSRQTDILLAAGKTGKALNIKKGQFLAPWDMKNVAEKVASTGNTNIMLCERGTSFGYNTLVTDFRSLPIMSETGYPVVFDATHSVQEPGGLGSSSGGKRKYAPILARAAIATGVAAVFAEAHEDPDNAPSDGPNMIPIDWVALFLEDMKRIQEVVFDYKLRGM